MHFYSLSTDLKPDWNHSHGYQPDIQEYWKDLAHKHDIYSHVVFGCKVVSAEWDDAKQLYTIVTEDVRTGLQTTSTAEILVSAIGVLEIPKYPDIPGLSTFKGSNFHSARWDVTADLRKKRVGVIGNGASA